MYEIDKHIKSSMTKYINFGLKNIVIGRPPIAHYTSGGEWAIVATTRAVRSIIYLFGSIDNYLNMLQNNAQNEKEIEYFQQYFS